MLKSVKIWLALIPIISLIGVILYVQSYKNQSELESQLIRSIEASKSDVIRALSDYYDRVDAYFLQHGSAHAAKQSEIKHQSDTLISFSKFKPVFTNARFVSAADSIDDNLSIENNEIVKKGKIIRGLGLANEYNLTDFINKFKVSKTGIKPRDEDSLVIAIDLVIPTFDLLRKQNSNKIFEHFFLTDVNGEIIYPDKNYGAKLFDPKEIVIDTLGVTHTGTSIIKLDLSEVPSKAYVASIPLENKKIYAVGVISEEAYQKVGLRIDFSKISIFLLFLFILISLIPVLGVINLSVGDNLTQNKVTLVGLSLMSLTLIIGYSFSQFKNLPDPVEQQKPIVYQLENDIGCSLLNHQSLLDVLVSTDEWESENGKFNELIEFLKTGFVRRIQYQSSGKTLDFEKNFKKTSIDLSSREYYGYFYQGDTVLVPKNAKKVFLNSHYSRFDAQLESVISKVYQYDKNPQSQIDSLGRVHALTFKLKSDSAISESYRYLVIKNDGKILLKSNKISSPIENLQEAMTQEKWGEISALMKNNKDSAEVLKTSLYLNGNHYTGLIKKIQNVNFDQDIWLFFMVNNNLSYSFSSLSTAESTALVFLYFLSLLLNLFIQLNSKRSKNKYGTKAFIYSWLEPVSENLPRLSFLAIAYLFYGAALAGIYYFSKINHLDFLLLMIFSSYLISFSNLSCAVDKENFEDFSELKFQHFPIRLILVGVINIMLLVLVAALIPKLLLPASILTVICILIILLWHLRFKMTWHVSQDWKDYTVPAFLCMWFFVIAFLPGYFMQSKNQQFEQEIWENTVANSSSEIKEWNDYEFSRRAFLSMIADPFDQKILDFISPNLENFSKTMEGSNIGFPGIFRISKNLFIVLTFFVFFIISVNGLHKIIFFPIILKSEPEIDFSKNQIFIVCSESSRIEKMIQDRDHTVPTDTIDLKLFSSLKEIQLDLSKKRFHLSNLHCVKDQMEILPIISLIAKLGKQLIISSGKTWHELIISNKEIIDQVKYSETFTQFEFRTIPIDLRPFTKEELKEDEHFLHQQAHNEMLMEIEVAKFADIWSELNFQEKLVCHSFSMERFFNHSRKRTIKGLIRKGIIIECQEKKTSSRKDHERKNLRYVHWKRYEFFSRMFQTYILNNVSKEEIKSFKEFESKNGNANLIQISTLSFVLICFALIGIFDKTFFDEVYAYLTGSIGLIGSIYTILNGGLSSLKFGKQK